MAAAWLMLTCEPLYGCVSVSVSDSGSSPTLPHTLCCFTGRQHSQLSMQACDARSRTKILYTVWWFGCLMVGGCCWSVKQAAINCSSTPQTTLLQHCYNRTTVNQSAVHTAFDRANHTQHCVASRRIS